MSISKLRTFGMCLAFIYLGIGMSWGFLLYASIPAMNAAGWAYYTLTWPAFLCSGTKVCKGAPYIPPWSFTFEVAA